MEAAGNSHSDAADFHSLFSIPLSSLFNFQRNSQQQSAPAQPQQHLNTMNEFDANYLLEDHGQQQDQWHRHHSRQYNEGAAVASAGPFNYFTSQSSADSAHYSGNEEDPCSSPQIKRDASTPINLMEFGFEPSEMEIDTDDLSLPASMLLGSRPNHSEVEKMRRDRMNSSINSMARLVPSCRSASRKLDKLTVLRLAAQHIKLLRARSNSLMQTPADLFSGEELQLLLSNKSSLQGFLLVVECDRARILGAANCNNHGIPGASISSSDLIGQCLLDLVHPRDAELIRQQLTVPELPAAQQQQQQQRQSQRYSGDNRANCGLRRRFFCRFRHPGGASSAAGTVATSGGPTRRRGDTRQYVYLSCSGLLHLSDDPASASELATEDSRGAAAAASSGSQSPQKSGSSCLLLVCRPARPLVPSALPSSARSGRDGQFSAKLGLDARFTWVDQRVTSILGHLPQDLISSSLYDLINRDDVNRLSVAHRSALKGTRSRLSCRLSCAWQPPANSEVVCQLSLLCFINPCTGRPEMLSLTCDLQQQQQQQQQHHLDNEVSFPSGASSTVSDPQYEYKTGADCGSSAAAQLGMKIAADLLPSPSDEPGQKLDRPPESGWLALGQLICSQGGGQQSFDHEPSLADGSLDTTRMCLLGADGGLGDEPDIGSMLWPL